MPIVFIRTHVLRKRQVGRFPAKQARLIQDAISRGVDAILVVPNNAQSLEPVFAQAKQAGIAVITHESPNQKNADFDIEMINNEKFGQAGAELLAQGLGGKGDFVVYVGSLTVPAHNLLADVALKLAKEKYPDLKVVADRFPVSEDQNAARQKSLGGNLWTAFLVACSVGAFLGAVNGLLIHFIRIPPIITTIGTLLDVIATVVLGGANIMGGSGSLLGTCLGVALLAMLGNGLTMVGMSSYWNNVMSTRTPYSTKEIHSSGRGNSRRNGRFWGSRAPQLCCWAADAGELDSISFESLSRHVEPGRRSFREIGWSGVCDLGDRRKQ
jgi:hypothetical protein